MAKQIKCPKCGSTNVSILGENKKSFSAGKAVGGAILTGGVGLLAGFVGKKKGYDLLCNDCGTAFQVKKL